MKEVKVFRGSEWIALGKFEDPTSWIEEGKKERWWGDPNLLTFEITDVTLKYELEKIIAARRTEYPGIEEFLNAFFDGGDAAIEELRQKRLAVKAKYPKPQTGEK